MTQCENFIVCTSMEKGKYMACTPHTAKECAEHRQGNLHTCAGRFFLCKTVHDGKPNA